MLLILPQLGWFLLRNPQMPGWRQRDGEQDVQSAQSCCHQEETRLCVKA